MKKKLIVLLIPVVIFGLITLININNKNVKVKKDKYQEGNSEIKTASEYLISKANTMELKPYTTLFYEDGNKSEMYTFYHASGMSPDYLTDYRYIGSIPNNYIYFNCTDENDESTCEVWRIIGVFKVKDENGNEEERLKIVRNNPVNNLGERWDDNYATNWSDASLKDKLNGEYLESLSSKSKEMIKETNWKTGDVSLTSEAGYLYYYELSNSYWYGKVALIRPSDYAYTFLLGVDYTCSDNLTSCVGKPSYSWLESYKGNPLSSWIGIMNSNNGSAMFTTNYIPNRGVFTISIYGCDYSNTGVPYSKIIYPTVYLKNDVYIVSGNGSMQYPYKLDLNPNPNYDESSYVIEAKDSYLFGDIVEYNGEKYYVLEDSDETKDYVSLLKETALSISEIKRYTKNKYKNGLVPFYYSDNCKATNNSDCLNHKDYDGSYIKIVVDKWASDRFNDDDLVVVDGYKSALLDEKIINTTYFESATNSLENIDYGTLTPYWLINIPKHYWTMTEKNHYFDNGRFMETNNLYESYAVRPVVNIKKSALKNKGKQSINVEYKEQDKNELKKKEYQANDKIIYKDEVYYVLKKSEGDEDYVTLVKEEPLVKSEVEKYYSNVYSSDSEHDYGLVDLTTDSGNYNNSNVKEIVDAWARDKFGYEIASAGLLTVDDLVDYLYFEADKPIDTTYNYVSGSSTPDWVINNLYSFWTSTPYEDSNYMWYVANREQSVNGAELLHGEKWTNSIYSDLSVPFATIRPVIKVHKCAIDPNDTGCEECLKKQANYTFDRYKSFNAGDEITFSGEEFYVARTSNSLVPNVTLIRKTPFTAEELNEYGVDEQGNSIINNPSYTYSGNSTAVLDNKAYEFGNGIGGMQYYSNNKCGYVNQMNHDECTRNYDTSYVKPVIDAWVNDKFNDDDLVSINGYKARLVNFTDQYTLEKLNLNDLYLYWFQMSTYEQKKVYINNYGKIIPIYPDGYYYNLDIRDYVYIYPAVWPVINVKKCSLDGGCLTENVELKACYIQNLPDNPIEIEKDSEDVKIVEIENTKKNSSIIVYIIGFVLIILGLYYYNKNIKSRN